jgi:enoyl-CoA hydratase
MLQVELRSGVTVVELRHGKVNALDLELLRAVTAAMRGIDGAGPVVLTGAGPAFCAGVDLQRIVDGGPSYIQEFLPALAETFRAVFDHPGPVVAAVNGHAIAGGCVLVAACDARLMSAGTIGLAELSVGVPFPVAAMEILRHAYGPAASRLVLTAELFDPVRAQSLGLVDAVCPPEDLLESALRQAQRMARAPAGVFAFSKRQLQEPARDQLAVRDGDDAAVLALWLEEQTRESIAGYLTALKSRPRAGS